MCRALVATSGSRAAGDPGTAQRALCRCADQRGAITRRLTALVLPEVSCGASRATRLIPARTESATRPRGVGRRSRGVPHVRHRLSQPPPESVSSCGLTVPRCDDSRRSAMRDCPTSCLWMSDRPTDHGGADGARPPDGAAAGRPRAARDPRLLHPMDVAPRSPNAGVRAATAFTCFPLYDRNPQRFVPNVFAPKPEDSGRRFTASGIRPGIRRTSALA